MQISQSPTLVPLPFADAGTKNTIPESASPTPGLASLTTGFPPITMTPIAAGGIPPTGADFNGILNLITQSIRWANAGGGYKYNSAFATDTNVDGYPQSAVILRGDGMGYWLNLADNNTTDPEGATPANWAPLESYGITAVTGLTNANVTLTPAQYGMSIITLAGTLTGNVQIIFPALKSQWKIVNATTGAFTVTCKTASGTGVIVNQGGEANVYGDGTNIILNALQVAPATASNQAVSMSQVQNLAGMRNLVGINNATNPNTQFDISADQVLVRNPTTGLVVNVVGSLKTNDITVAGPAANGRDQAAAFTASTWIHLYWIYNPTTSTLATITSVNAPTTGPTLPTGYTHWAYIHALFLGAGPALPVVRIRNQRSTYVLAQTSLNLGGSTSVVSVNVASLVPPNALDFSIAIQTIAILSSGSGGAATTVFLEVANGAATHRAAFTLTAVAASTQFSMSGPSFEMPNIGQQYLYVNVIGSGTSPQTTQAIESYTVSNGAA